MPASTITDYLFILLLALFSIGACADDSAAMVKIVVGNAWSESPTGERFAISEGQRIAPGATLVTENGIIQLRFRDGGFMVVQKNTRFRIDKFSYSGKEDGTEWAVFNLIKGGLRAISGTIGHARAKRYGVRTAYGTIGIRGTAYKLLVCETECKRGEQRTYAQGMHAETNEGTIFIENTAGIFDVPAGKSAFVKDAVTLPVFSTFSPNFVQHDSLPANKDSLADEPVDGASDNGEAKRVNVAVRVDSKPHGDARIMPLKTATKRIDAGTNSPGVQILSRPGQPLIVGMKADMTKSLIQATAAINGDVLAPIVALDVPALSMRPVNDRDAVNSILRNAPTEPVARHRVNVLPRVMPHPQIATIRGAPLARLAHGVGLAHSAAKAKVILQNVGAIAAVKAATASIPNGIAK